MRKLLKYLKDYKKESMIGPLFKLLEACFELVVPLIMANMIDIGIRNGIYFKNGQYPHFICGAGAVLFPDCPVFCGESIGGVWNGAAA